MSVFNRRYAIVGFLTLKAASRTMKRRRRKQRLGRGLRLALFAALALPSLGIFAAIAAAFLRRRGPGGRRLEGYAVAEGAETEEGAEAERAAAARAEAPSEPIAAT